MHTSCSPHGSWSFPLIIVLPIWEGDYFHVCTSPSLLWLQLFVRYYACTNQGHNFLVREEFTVCMWELHRKRKTMHDSWCSRTNFHCGNTYTHGKWITYLLWSVFVLLSMQNKLKSRYPFSPVICGIKQGCKNCICNNQIWYCMSTVSMAALKEYTRVSF